MYRPKASAGAAVGFTGESFPDNLDLYLAVAYPCFVEVHEIDMPELPHVELAVNDDDAFAPTENHGTQMAVRIQRVKFGFPRCFRQIP